MNIQTKKKNLFRHIASGMMLFFVFSFFGFSTFLQPIYTHAAATPGKFVIKLKSANFVPTIKKYGYGVEHRFVFSTSPEFGNIYTFESPLPLSDLLKDLQGVYEYLAPKVDFAPVSIELNDEGFTNNPHDIDKEWALPKAGFVQAWNRTTGNSSNTVAVIDTGIDETHADLKSITFVEGYNTITRQQIPVGVNSDDNGHGTLIAGVLGATPNNYIGIVGTNWQISIMPVKALDSAGKGDSTAVAEAIVWAADHGAAIINLSLSGIGSGHDTSLANAISYAFGKNDIIVAAAGNDVATTGGNLDTTPVYPICDDNNSNMIIGVAATDHNDQKASFSDFGKLCIDVSAPGKRILTTINRDPGTQNSSPNSYAYVSGTSLAVPFVSGQAALIRSLYPRATNAQVRDRIIATADPIDFVNTSQCGGLTCQGMLGSGRINVERSIETAIITSNVLDGDLISVTGKNIAYHIVGGQKRLVSNFVLGQKFPHSSLKSLPETALVNVPEGPAETPLNGTLVKTPLDPTVYVTINGQKLPVTYQVFLQRNFSFSNVNSIDPQEVSAWPLGNFLPPVDGTLLRTAKNKTVYWVVGGILHPINYNFYIEKGLSIFPVLFVGDNDIQNFPKGEAFIK
jgi:hypothetical protein